MRWLGGCRLSGVAGEQLPSHVECQDQQERCRGDAGRVPELSQRPEWMPDPVYELDHDPKPGQRRGRRPVSPNRPEETPQAKHDERDIEDEETALEVL